MTLLHRIFASRQAYDKFGERQIYILEFNSKEYRANVPKQDVII
jgi:hypothetical protein